jgi:YD repeat-containing protein
LGPQDTYAIGSNSYDYRDRITNSVDANGVSTVMTYDELDRVLTRTFPDTGAEGFRYSTNGLVAYTNQLSNVMFYTNDAAVRKVAELNANSELTRFAYDPS